MNLEGLRPHLQWVPVCAGISRDPLTQEGAPPPLFIPKVEFFVPYMHYFIECCFKTKKKNPYASSTTTVTGEKTRAG